MNPFTATARKLLTLSGGAGAHAHNVFLVTCPVRLDELYGVVTDALAAGLTAAYFDLWDGTLSTPLTLNTAVLSSLPVGSWLGKQYEASDALTVQTAATGALVELSGGLAPMHPAVLVPKTSVATYIRLRYASAGAASGVIDIRASYGSHGGGGVSAA